MSRSAGYLSGAPRVSTRDDSESVGPRAHVLGMIGAFEKLGFEVRRYILGDRSLESASKGGSGRVLSRSSLTRALADVGRLVFRYVNPQAARRSIGTDLVFVYERFGAFQAVGRPFQRRGIPWILETNALYFVEGSKDRKAIFFWRLERWLELRAYRQCDVLIAITDALRDQIRATGVNREILVVPNGVDVDRFSAVTPRRPPDAPPRVLFVGSAIEAQGVDVLLRALATVRDRDQVVDCLIVGDGPELDSWKTLAARLGLQERVHFRGRVPWSEVPAVAADCDVGFVGPRPTSTASMYHSSLKLYEYLASGLSVVARREPAVCELLAGGPGYLFDPDDPDSCADAITAAIAARAADPDAPDRARALAKRESWESRAQVVLAALNGGAWGSSV